MGASDARRGALQVLRRLRRGALLDRAAAPVLAELEPRDRSFTHELVWGVQRLRGRLDHLLDGLVRDGVASLHPDTLDVLRLGAYQVLEMTGVPAYAAVSQSVELARDAGQGRAVGLVNGVLQRLVREERLPSFPSWEEDPEGHLATWGSHPRWLVERWFSRYGRDAARALVESNNRRPELFLTLLGMEPGAALRALGEAGISGERVTFAPTSIRLENADPATALALVPAVVQDPAAALVVEFAELPRHGAVADLCAAPGGKALTLAAEVLPLAVGGRSGGERFVVAGDASFARLRRVRENAARLPAPRLAAVAADARLPPLRPLAAALVDAPCTGTGTLRRHPDGKWRLRPTDLVGLTTLQAAILDGAATVVAPGGLLVYATCSLEAEENERQVEAFLERHPEFRVEAGRLNGRPGLVDERGFLRVLPWRVSADGAFAARLRRDG